MFKEPRKVSVIIATYQRGAVLCDTIEQVLAQDYPDLEVIVVDQTPLLPTSIRECIERHSHALKYIRLDRPNLPAARNVGVRASTGDVIVFVDDDVRVDRGYIQSHVRAYDRDPSIGGILGLPLPPQACDEAALIEEVLALFGTQQRLPDGRAYVKTVVGCNCSFLRKAFFEAGMSDERFAKGWAEDTDLSMRVRHLGYNLLFDPDVRLVHLALPTGGCAFRDEAALEKTKRYRSVLSLFLSLKNAHILGLAESCRRIWGEYRACALNRQLLGNPFLLLRNQCIFASSFTKACALFFDKSVGQP